MKTLRVSAVTVLVVTVALCLRAQVPDAFVWKGGTSNNWDAADVWMPTATARTAPGIAGDSFSVTNAAQLSFAGDKTISGLSSSVGTLSLCHAAPAAITFDSGSATVTNRVIAQSFLQACQTVAPDLTLSFNILRNLRWTIGSSGSSVRAYVGAKISGGSDESPIDMLVDSVAGSYKKSYLVFFNPSNDFRGDIHVGLDSSANNLSLVLGYGSNVGYDSALGNTNNKIFLHGKNSSGLWVKSGDPGGLRRTVVGTGTIGGGYINGSYDGFSSDNLVLGAGCSLEPMSLPSNPIGTNTVTVNGNWNANKSITTDPDSQIRLTLSSNRCDLINFQPRAAFTYSGKIILEPDRTFSPGTVWTIMQIQKEALSVTLAPSFVTSGFQLTLFGNSTDGWTVQAAKTRDLAVMPDLSTQPVTGIAEDYATMRSKVAGVAPDGQAVIRAYVDTVDHGENVAAWAHVYAYSDIATGSGDYAQAITGLQNHTTYYVRHSISNTSIP